MNRCARYGVLDDTAVGLAEKLLRLPRRCWMRSFIWRLQCKPLMMICPSTILTRKGLPCSYDRELAADCFARDGGIEDRLQPRSRSTWWLCRPAPLLFLMGVMTGQHRRSRELFCSSSSSISSRAAMQLWAHCSPAQTSGACCSSDHRAIANLSRHNAYQLCHASL